MHALRIYRQWLFAAPFLDRVSESMVGQKLGALQSLVRHWRRLSQSEVELNGGPRVGMTITGHNRIVEGVMGDWASKICRDELIHIIVHVVLDYAPIRKLDFFWVRDLFGTNPFPTSFQAAKYAAC
jgi:hypothetical protein